MFEKNICSRVNSQNGFTLIEVVVAMIIVSVSLVMVMQLFSSGLKSSRTTCDYTTAVIHARDKMEEFLLDPVSGSGEFEDGFSWSSEIEAYKEPEESLINLMKLKIIVMWPDGAQGQRSIELVSLKAVSEEEEL
ncbi:MAG: type II secretion system protein [Nitrospirota bacterium]